MRADRAVKVSKKELNELISELMDYMEPSDDENDAEASLTINASQMSEANTTVMSIPSTPVLLPSSPQVLQVISQSPKNLQVQVLSPGNLPKALTISTSEVSKIFLF